MINRQNFEAFFLQYVDNELFGADKQAVLQFVQDNADLAEELDLLMKLRLNAETIAFPDKASLYRTAPNNLVIEEAEALYLLNLDNELPEDKQAYFYNTVLKNPELQIIFEELNQTKLLSETVVFPFKEGLYKKEEKKPIVFMRRWQWIAAASIFAFSLLLWNLLQDSPFDKKALVNSVSHSVPLKNTYKGIAQNKIVSTWFMQVFVMHM